RCPAQAGNCLSVALRELEHLDGVTTREGDYGDLTYERVRLRLEIDAGDLAAVGRDSRVVHDLIGQLHRHTAVNRDLPHPECARVVGPKDDPTTVGRRLWQNVSWPFSQP